MPAPPDHLVRQVLAAGLGWLFDTVQPEGAILQHHGTGSPGYTGRRYRFCPDGLEHGCVVVVEGSPAINADGLIDPMTAAEVDTITRLLAELGRPVWRPWNGAGLHTGSFALDGWAHPSLRQALARYRAGCPTHDGDVFCGRSHHSDPCTWYADGHRLVVEPTWPAAG